MRYLSGKMHTWKSTESALLTQMTLASHRKTRLENEQKLKRSDRERSVAIETGSKKLI